ncbi:tRNA isopentenyl-2-thiomethyl-A-37 hydroxylase MiaE, partial [Salmonella enterica]|uniref:tRNA isopentenyl-2-thiomethyl-A-37 hydroxylase MiaE n=1 Tax=Salmonella enterica TaxID=28901 RepID=UPI00398C35E0
LAPWLDEDIQTFYLSLLRSEAWHYQDYLALAQQISAEDNSARVRYFGEVEADLILSPDREFRFHSGVPAAVYRVKLKISVFIFYAVATCVVILTTSNCWRAEKVIFMIFCPV